jgi:hypothetical protein
MRPIFLGLFATVMVAQVTKPTIISTQQMVSRYPPQAGGDTHTLRSVIPPNANTCPNGTFKGGTCVYGQWGDGTLGESPSYGIAIYQLVYDPSNINNSTMTTGTTVAGNTRCTWLNAGPSDPKYNLYAIDVRNVGTDLYVTYTCLTVENVPSCTFCAVNMGTAIAPAAGGYTHWCNYTTYINHTGSPGCDSSNWVSGFDLPTSQADFQWPSAGGAGDFTSNKIEYLNCVVSPQPFSSYKIPGLDTSYTYCLGRTGDRANGYAFRFHGDQMLPANWEAYNRGTWDSNLAHATATSGGCIIGPQYVMYLPDFQKFAYVGQLNEYPACISTADYPWGPYSSGISFTSNLQNHFPILMPASYNVTGGGHVQVVLVTNDKNGANLSLQLLDLGMVTPALRRHRERLFRGRRL